MRPAWRAVGLPQLQSRDFGDASIAVRARLQAGMQTHAAGGMQTHAAGRVLRETWTL